MYDEYFKSMNELIRNKNLSNEIFISLFVIKIFN